MAGTLPSLQSPNQAFTSCWLKLLRACSIDWIEDGYHWLPALQKLPGEEMLAAQTEDHLDS